MNRCLLLLLAIVIPTCHAAWRNELDDSWQKEPESEWTVVTGKKRKPNPVPEQTPQKPIPGTHPLRRSPNIDWNERRAQVDLKLAEHMAAKISSGPARLTLPTPPHTTITFLSKLNWEVAQPATPIAPPSATQSPKSGEAISPILVSPKETRPATPPDDDSVLSLTCPLTPPTPLPEPDDTIPTQLPDIVDPIPNVGSEVIVNEWLRW